MRPYLRATLLLLLACNKKATSSDAGQSESMSEVTVGGDATGTAHLSFRLEKTYQAQKPIDHAPWHEAGGDWTFGDAVLADGTHFGLGLSFPASNPDQGPIRLSEAMITVPSAAQGAKVVDAFAKAFHAKNMPPMVDPQPLRFRPIGAALLGTGQAKRGNGFGGTGNWTATKIFLQREGVEAEAFLNVDFEGKKGEFSEKDAEYADDLVAFMALDLRDGPRPARTAATDPSISDVGPKPERWVSIGPNGVEFRGFSHDGSKIIFSKKEGNVTQVLEAPSADPTKTTELLRTENRAGALVCARDADTCLFIEERPKRAHVYTSEDPATANLVDRKTKAKRELHGPWGEKVRVSGAPISPDGRYVVLNADRAKYFVPTSGNGDFVKVESTGSVEAWTGHGKLLAAIVSEEEKEDSKTKLYFSVDPTTGKKKPLAGRPAGSSEDKSDSPDGKRHVSCADGVVTVANVGGGNASTFRVHPDDRRDVGQGCPEWLSPRYLSFPTSRPAVLDANTMKLSWITGPDEPLGRVEYDPTFTWMVSSNDGVRIARLVVR